MCYLYSIIIKDQPIKHTASLKPMIKPSFTLEETQFSDSDNETPINSLVAQYNREYSIIYQQIKSFLKQCKDNINKYIQLNQFGARFNIFALYAQMTNIETSTLTGVSDVSKQQLQHQQTLKITYEKEFQDILERMENVIKDFLKFQIDFKREYFGINIRQADVPVPNKRGLRGAKNSLFRKMSRQSSQRSDSSANRRSSRTFLEDEEERKETEQKETELEQKLREILKRKLAPQKENIIKFCDKESDPYKNMLKLEQKIDMMQSEMILSKTREEKIIEIFSKRRIENIQPKGHELVHSQLIETDSGQRLYGNGLVSKSQAVYTRQNPGQTVKKGVKLMKHSLEMEVVNEKIEQKVKSPKGKLAPRQLISPKGMRSPKQGNVGSINFLCSPKNSSQKKMQVSHQGFRFKKKRQLQMVDQGRGQKSKISSVLQKMAKEQKQGREDGLGGGVGQVNKNREKFLSRRKSNNQNFRVGDYSFFE